MAEMPFALSESELLALLNDAPGVHIERRAFGRSIRSLMVERGEARQVGAGRTQPWVYDPDYIWEWLQYLAVRAELIRRGVWASNRPYSIGDMEDITRLDAYSDVLDQLFPREPVAAHAEWGEAKNDRS